MEFERFLELMGANIRQARHLAGLTQEEVQGITLRYFSEVERGLRNPTVGVLHMLAGQFGCTVADLVDAPGARLSSPRLEKRKPKNPPKAGRKPRTHPRSR